MHRAGTGEQIFVLPVGPQTSGPRIWCNILKRLTKAPMGTRSPETSPGYFVRRPNSNPKHSRGIVQERHKCDIYRVDIYYGNQWNR
jgi:hypothetical protein